MKKILFFALTLLCALCCSAQNKVSFEYDASGNRIKRTLAVATRSLAADEQPEEIISEQIAKRGIKIYSSIQGQITVEISTLEGMKTGTMAIYDSSHGKLVLTRAVKFTREDLDISSQRAGVYILVVEIDGEKTSYKLIKK